MPAHGDAEEPEEPDAASFAAVLRRHRLAAGLTQEALAERAGLGVRTLQGVEGGRRPQRATAGSLADALGLTGAAREGFLAAAGPPPPRRGAGARHDGRVPAPGNLPAELYSFVGRERELAAVAGLLATARLLTLTGPGGVGKTRLALQAAAAVRARFPDGVWLVELAPLADAALVPQAVAAAVGVREAQGRPLRATLSDALRPQRLLLVLDNCEHLLAACARLADALLRACPAVRVLATSREALGIAGEVPYRVPSLALPDPDRPPPAAALLHAPAVRLFVARARAAAPGFRLTDRNAAAVAQVCVRLDGIPLALELAAARMPVLSVERLLDRQEDRFRLLTGGARTALPRQQTLRAAVDWSYALLTAPERRLFAHLAVFAGGFTLEAAEAVGADAGFAAGEVLDLLTRLVDQSLVDVLADESPDGTARHRLLETLRQYAEERLAATGEAAAARRRHAAYYLALAERAAPELEGPRQRAWLDRLEAEEDNLRQALRWSQAEGGSAAAGLRLGGALRVFWQLRGHLAEGRRWLAAVLAAPRERASDRPRAAALFAAGMLAYLQGDHAAAHAALEQSLALCRELDDPAGGARALSFLAAVALRRSEPGARALAEEAVACARAAGAPHPLAMALFYLGTAAGRSAPDAARTHLAESLARFRAVGDGFWCSAALSAQAGRLRAAGDDAAARVTYEEALAIRRRLGERRGEAALLYNLAVLDQRAGDRPGARTKLTAALGRFQAVGDRHGAAWCLAGLAALAEAAGHPEQAARLLGAAEPHLMAEALPLHPPDAADRAGTLSRVRRRLGEPAFAAAWAAGQAMSLEQAVAAALADAPAPG